MATTQENRIAKVHTSLPDDTLVLTRLSGEESFSRLFRFDLELVAPPDSEGAPAKVPFEDVIGQALTVEIETTDRPTRYFHGIVSRFVRLGMSDGFTTYEAELVPWMWLLTRNARCRIFENLTTAEIVKQVFGDLPTGDVTWAGQSGGGETRLHTVQYQESDFAFVSRLLEQDGTLWWFGHGLDTGPLTLCDAKSQGSVLSDPKIPVSSSAGADRPGSEWGGVDGWIREHSIGSGKFRHTDWNWHDPGALADATAEGKNGFGRNERFEWCEYPGEYVKLGQETDPKSRFGDDWAALRQHETDAAAGACRARSDRIELSPGRKIELGGHFADDGVYLVTSVEHHLDQPLSVGMGQRDAGDRTSYANAFTCIPDSVPFVPPRKTPRPRIHGPQTAVVVSDEAEEPGKSAIDPMGRVKVDFHWNYGQGTTDSSSCWLRVAQAQAGAGWGAQFHPRVGHEVVVGFLDGDPDRPIILGAVYNAKNEPPYALPHLGGMKSRTLDGSAENFNEIRFSDEKGSEEFHQQAEKDWTIYVKNDEQKEIGANRSEKVGGSASITIDADRTEKVGGDRSLDVGGAKTESVGGAKSITVTGNLSEEITGTMSVSVGKDRSVSTAAKLTISAAGDVSRSGAKSLTESVGKDATLSIGGDSTTSVGKGAKTTVEKGYSLEAKEISIEAKDQITLKAGKAEIILKKSGDIQIKGKKITIKGSSDVIVKGSKIGAN